MKILSYLVRTLFQPLFLFSLFVTNSAVIYCACILEHTQTSLALEIMQKAIISPAPKTMYIKDGVFQYNHYIEDLEDVKLYLRNQKINSSINVVGRGGDVFLIPRILRPIVKKITGKRHYELITKLISAGAVITIAGFTFNSIKEIKTVNEKILLPVLSNPKKAARLKQCLNLYLETHNIKNIGELLVKPKLWGDLYSQLLFISGDLVALAKDIDYYKLFSYLAYFSGLNFNIIIGLSFLTLLLTEFNLCIIIKLIQRNFYGILYHVSFDSLELTFRNS